MQFPREDLGFGYRNGAVIQEMSPPSSSACRPEAKDGPSNMRGAVSTFVPSSAPGFRLPHCWLEDRGQSLHLFPRTQPLEISSAARLDLNCQLLSTGGQASAFERLSSLDLAAGTGEPSLLLVVTEGNDNREGASWRRWVRAALMLKADGFASSLRVAVVRRGDAPRLTSTTELEGASSRTAAVLYDAEGRWHEVIGVPNGSLVVHLVRPDGHVAWRWLPPATVGSSDEPGDLLSDSVRRILHVRH